MAIAMKNLLAASEFDDAAKMRTIGHERSELTLGSVNDDYRLLIETDNL